jgi:hypothetical protein
MEWHQQPGTADRWIAVDGEGRQVGWVALTVGPGAAYRYSFAWKPDGSSVGLTVGEFATAEDAMQAVEASL